MECKWAAEEKIGTAEVLHSPSQCRSARRIATAMTSLPKPAYITTPIYYVNDKPHIGHAYTTTLCDVWARAMRFRKRDVFFLTGTDEHGRKVEKSAQARGVTPQELADENSAEFRRVLGLFGL